MRVFCTALAFIFASSCVFASDDRSDARSLAEEYVSLPGVQKMLHDMFSPQILGDQFAVSLPPEFPLSEEQVSDIGALMSSKMMPLIPRMSAVMEDNFADNFSANELAAMIEFYESKHGSEILRKTPMATQDAMAQMMPDMMLMQQEMLPEILAILEMN